jgi:hypothetical protein
MSTTSGGEWVVLKPGGECKRCKKELGPGEEYFSVVSSPPEEESRVLQRQQFCLSCWDGLEKNFFCYWRARVPVPPQKQSEVAAGVVEAFERMVRDPSPEGERKKLLYLITLWLLRKRRLKLVKEASEEMVVEVTKTGTVHRIFVPFIGEDELAALSRMMELVLAPVGRGGRINNRFVAKGG